MPLISSSRSLWLSSVSLVCVAAFSTAALADEAAKSDLVEPIVIAQAATPPAAEPDATSETPVEKVTVTARRRSQTLFDVPASVTVIGGDTLKKNGVSDIKSIIALTPNAVVPQDPQSFNTFINIRGIRQVDVQAEPNFGLFRNGIFNGGQRTNLGVFVDIERVEILRGPQGGLYGRNAVGGAVNVIYAMPTDEFGGYVAGKAGRYGRTDLEGAINVPISESFAMRAAGWYFNQDEGEMFNDALGEEIDAFNNQGGRLSARADLSDTLSVTWTAEYQEADTPSRRTYAPNGVPFVLGGCCSTPETIKRIHRDSPNRNENNSTFLSQDVRWETSWGTLNLLAAHREYELNGTEDLDGTTFGPETSPFNVRQVQNRAEAINNDYVELLWVSPEDQRLSWVAGISYFDETFDFNRTLISTVHSDLLDFFIGGFYAGGGVPGIYSGNFAFPGATSTLPGGTTIGTESFSTFAEFTYKVTPKFDVLASLRYTNDKKMLNLSQAYVPTNGGNIVDTYFAIVNSFFLASFDLNTVSEFDNWSPGVGFSYRHSDTLNFYGVIQTGFRAGGFSTTTATAANVPYDQEEAINYELGAKSLWFGGKLGVNLAVFDMEQSNLAVFQLEPPPNPFGLGYYKNIGHARTYGAEAEAFARLADWLTARASVGWLDTKITEGDPAGVASPIILGPGDAIPQTRKWTVNLLFDVDQPIDNDLRLVSAINWRLEYGGEQAGNELRPYDDLNKLDVRLGLAMGSTRLVAYVDNAFDDRVTEFEFFSGQITPNYGRTFGVQASTEF